MLKLIFLSILNKKSNKLFLIEKQCIEIQKEKAYLIDLFNLLTRQVMFNREIAI